MQKSWMNFHEKAKMTVNKNTCKIIELQSVLLQNFKIHRELEVDLSSRMTTIVGPNYSGKTTIIQAIFYALFGSVALPGAKETALTRGEKSGSVALTLLWGEDEVRVVRTLSTAMLYVNQELMASGHTSVTGFCRDMFGLDIPLILKLARSTRGEISSLLEDGAAKLNRLLEEVNNTAYADQLKLK